MYINSKCQNEIITLLCKCVTNCHECSYMNKVSCQCEHSEIKKAKKVIEIMNEYKNAGTLLTN